MVVLTLLKSILPVEYANLLASKQADMVASGHTLQLSYVYNFLRSYIEDSNARAPASHANLTSIPKH